MYYRGDLRQRGGGLGDVFRAFTRSVKFKGVANAMKKKALGSAVRFGVGVLRDVSRQGDLKSAVKARGKTMIRNLVRGGTKRVLDAVLNTGPPKKRRQTKLKPRTGRTSRRGRKKVTRRARDIFDR